MARAIASTHRPYLLSFVLRPDGTLLDGTPLRQMIEEIDATITRPPTGYLINCVHPSILNQAMRTGSLAESLLARRILGLQANTSAKSPEELDGLATLETKEPASFGALMWDLHQQYGLRILGGCCGTDTRHIEHLAFLGSESNIGLIKR